MIKKIVGFRITLILYQNFSKEKINGEIQQHLLSNYPKLLNQKVSNPLNRKFFLSTQQIFKGSEAILKTIQASFLEGVEDEFKGEMTQLVQDIYLDLMVSCYNLLIEIMMKTQNKL